MSFISASVNSAGQGDFDSGIGFNVQPLDAAEFADFMMPFSLPDMAGQIAVGVSGGADSLALVGLLHEWGVARGVRIRALTVDHGLRVDSKTEAICVGEWLLRQNIDHHILTWKHAQNITTAVQARARTARYDLMTQWCRRHHVSHIFVAHHLDDQAETVLMRLKKGTTLFGLGGMKPQRNMNGVVLCRPLLSVPKARLVVTLQAKGQDWIEDPSNQNMDFERVRIRRLLPFLATEGVTPNRLVGIAQGAQNVCQIIDAEVDRMMKNVVIEHKKDQVLCVKADFFDTASVVQERLLSKLLVRVGQRAYAPNLEKVQRLIRWLARTSLGRRTLCGCLIQTQGNEFKISVESARKKQK